MKMRLSDLWRWDGEVDRGVYLAWGVILFAIKYNMDRALAAWVFHRVWSPMEYLLPGHVFQLGSAEDVRFCLWMLALALPFVWAGVALTLRRLRGAGLPLWLVALFFVPMLSLLFFAMLSVLPNHQPDSLTPAPKADSWLRRCLPQSSMGCTLVGIVVTALFGLGVMALSVEIFKTYGLGLFVMAPFCVGLIAVLFYGAREPKRYGACIGVACLAVTMVGALFLMFALEGLVCILMAAPLAVPLAILGGSVGYFIQRREGAGTQGPPVTQTLVMVLPLLMMVEHVGQPSASLMKVQTTVDIAAPPAVVWRHVVEFSEILPPTEWLFRIGIAYPIRAEIGGRGVGAVRRCEFSTGAFVEPIEVWDEPRLLRFGVTSNPPPMEEWTPYRQIHPPHLDGFLASERGQFSLVPLADGGTRLEGTTWYRHHLWPELYWQGWSDYIIHRIHWRVLTHIKEESETEDAGVKPAPTVGL